MASVTLIDAPKASTRAPSVKTPDEKPLPTPPVLEPDSRLQSRNLLDATERPLKRTPPGQSRVGEDWPVLSPQRLQRAMLGKDETTAKEPVEMTGVIKKPASTTDAIPKLGATAIAIRKKPCPVTASAVRTPVMSTTSTPETATKSTSKISATFTPDTSGTSTPDTSATSTPPDMSPAAASIEKAGQAPLNFSLPRQTRTSELRARLTAEAVIRAKPSPRFAPLAIGSAVTTPERRERALRSGSGHTRIPTRATSRNAFPAKPNTSASSTRIPKSSKPPTVTVTDPSFRVLRDGDYMPTRLKRLSRSNSDAGGSLTILGAADRTIMGPASVGKENISAAAAAPPRSAKKPKDLHRMVLKKATRRAEADHEPPPLFRGMNRPHSIATDLQREIPGVPLSDRVQKAKSADVMALVAQSMMEDPFLETQSGAADPPVLDVSTQVCNEGETRRQAERESSGVNTTEQKTSDLNALEHKTPERLTTSEQKTPEKNKTTDETTPEQEKAPDQKQITPSKTTPKKTRDRYKYTPDIDDSPGNAGRPSKDFKEIQNRLGSSAGFGSRQIHLGPRGTRTSIGLPKTTPSPLQNSSIPRVSPLVRAPVEIKRESQASSSARGSARAKISMSGFRNLFRKSAGNGEAESSKEMEKGKGKEKSKILGVGVSGKGKGKEVDEAKNKEKDNTKVKGKGKSKDKNSLTSDPTAARPPTPSSSSALTVPTPLNFPADPLALSTEINTLATPDLLTSLLHSATALPGPSPHKARLLEMAGLVVDVLTSAREAEKALEMARVAAARAEMAAVLAQRGAAAVAQIVERWAKGWEGVF